MGRKELFHDSVETLIEMTHQVDVSGCGEGKVLEEFGFGSGAVEGQNLQCAEADNSLGRPPIHI